MEFHSDLEQKEILVDNSPPYLLEAQLGDLETLLSADNFERSIPTIESTQSSVNGHLTRVFNNLLTVLTYHTNNDVDSLGSRKLDAEKAGANSADAKTNLPTLSSSSIYLADVFEKVKQSILKDLINFIDDRLVADRLAYSNAKNQILQQLNVTRRSSALYRNAVDVSTNYKIAESVRLMKTEYQISLEKKNENLKKELNTIQSMYGTLCIVHEDSVQQLAALEKQVISLQNTIQASMLVEYDEDIASVSGNTSDNSKNNSIVTNGHSNLESIKDKQPCGDCAVQAKQMEVCESALRSAGHSLETSKHMIKQGSARPRRSASTSKSAVVIIKNAKFRGRDSQVSSITIRAAISGDESEDMTHRNESRQIDRKTSTIKTKNSRNKNSSTASSPSKLQQNGESKMLRTSSRDSLMSDVSEASNPEGRPSGSKASSGVLNSYKDAVKVLNTSERSGLQGLRYVPESVGKADDKALIVSALLDKYSVSSQCKEAVLYALYEGTPPISEVVTHISTQTEGTVETLLKTYFDATKQAASMYIETSHALQAHQSLLLNLEEENLEVYKQLRITEENWMHSEDLRDLQIKERNFLLIELSDQLTITRKKLQREQNIRNHVTAHDATIHLLDRHSRSNRKEFSLPSVRLDLTSEMEKPHLALFSGENTEPVIPKSHLVSGRKPPLQLISTERFIYTPSTGNQGSMDFSPLRSPKGASRRPSTVHIGSVRASLNTSMEFKRDVQSAPRSSLPSEKGVTSGTIQYPNNVERSRLVTGVTETTMSEVDHVIDILRLDEEERMDKDRLFELKDIRRKILHLIASKTSAKAQKEIPMATAKAAEAKLKGRAFMLNAKTTYL